MPAHRNDKKFKDMYALYQEGFSLEQVGVAFGVSRQSVYEGFKNRGYDLRSRPAPLPFIMFDGRKYTLRKNGYYGCTIGSRSLLHRDVWEKTNGPIPDGFDIHHIDRDKGNNAPENLEVIRKDTHAARYATGINGNTFKTHCVHGHEFTPENTYTWNGHRICRTCGRMRMRQYRG